jgi:hypothetical protein
MGDLDEWIRVNRPHDAGGDAIQAGPAPVAVSTPEETFDPVGVLLPSPMMLAQVGGPLLGALLVVFVIGGTITGAALAVRGASRKR